LYEILTNEMAPGGVNTVFGRENHDLKQKTPWSDVV